MIEFQSKKPKLSISLDGAVEVTFTAPRAKLEALTNLADKDFDITIKQHREKRSLDANAYAWVLITAIADELRMRQRQIINFFWKTEKPKRLPRFFCLCFLFPPYDIVKRRVFKLKIKHRNRGAFVL